MKSVLAIAAHPDDIEFLMAGTLMRLRDAGYTLHYLNIANGCCGSMVHDRETISRMRREESMQAAKTLGAVYHESMVDDLEIFYEKPLLAKVASVVRQSGAEILLTHAPADYMEDHMVAGRLAVTAAFVRGMPNFPVDPEQPPLQSPMAVYHAQPYFNHDPLGRLVKPKLYVDVSDLSQQKAELLSCHVTQKEWLDQTQGLDSYLHTLNELDEQVGKMSGVYRAAEGWRQHFPIGFGPIGVDPLGDALADYVTEKETDD